MGNYSTADELKQRHVEKLGPTLGTLYHELWNELAWLYMKWDDFVILFGTSPTRIDLLNKSAPVFFKNVQDTLWEDVLLHIARLTDSPKSNGKKNLTIQCLPGLVDESIRLAVSEQISNAKEKAGFCRDWRNRHIAHRDLNLAMGEQTQPLKQASRVNVIDALESISKVLSIISEFYMKSIVVFNSLAGPGRALDLLYVLDDGVKADIDRRKRIESGQYLPEDLNHHDL